MSDIAIDTVSGNSITIEKTDLYSIYSEQDLRKRWKQIIPDLKRRLREEILAMDNNP